MTLSTPSFDMDRLLYELKSRLDRWRSLKTMGPVLSIETTYLNMAWGKSPTAGELTELADAMDCVWAHNPMSGGGVVYFIPRELTGEQR